ncbi:MAG: CoA activase, partial [Christensenellaceae bacterium]|nr:CoA activase [Christensenellaceae bacterium]
MKFIGIDIGSTCAKTTVLDDSREILFQFVQPTGWSSVDTAEAIRVKLLDNGIDA